MLANRTSISATSETFPFFSVMFNKRVTDVPGILMKNSKPSNLLFTLIDLVLKKQEQQWDDLSFFETFGWFLTSHLEVGIDVRCGSW